MAAGQDEEPLDPYDELPYRSFPIEWTAPEWLALVSLLHGGPRPPRRGYRVLELGCGNGANLLALAHYRPHASFVGLDGGARALATAEARRAELALANLELVHADLRAAARRVTGDFDFIIAHGVLSWVPDDARDSLLALCAERLRPEGLVYLNYNTLPGWNIRGLVRKLLLAQTAAAGGLPARAELAQSLAGKLAAAFAAAADHPYSRLMEHEFRFVAESDRSYVAHEFLAADNRAYWRSELLALARGSGLDHVADADFNRPSGRLPPELPEQVAAAGLAGPSREDTVDLLCYRQLHSPVLARAGWLHRPPGPGELAGLFLASSLAPADPQGDGRRFRHPSGTEVSVTEPALWTALERLQPLWPRGLPLGELLPDATHLDDLLLLHRHGLLELRLVEPDDETPPAAPLHRLEHRSGYQTTAYHTVQAVPA